MKLLTSEELNAFDPSEEQFKIEVFNAILTQAALVPKLVEALKEISEAYRLQINPMRKAEEALKLVEEA